MYLFLVLCYLRYRGRKNKGFVFCFVFCVLMESFSQLCHGKRYKERDTHKEKQTNTQMNTEKITQRYRATGRVKPYLDPKKHRDRDTLGAGAAAQW